MPAAPSEWAPSHYNTAQEVDAFLERLEAVARPVMGYPSRVSSGADLTLEDVVVDLDVAEAPGLAHDARLGSDRGRHQDAAAGLVRRVEVDPLAVATAAARRGQPRRGRASPRPRPCDPPRRGRTGRSARCRSNRSRSSTIRPASIVSGARSSGTYDLPLRAVLARARRRPCRSKRQFFQHLLDDDHEPLVRAGRSTRITSPSSLDAWSGRPSSRRLESAICMHAQ